MYECKHSHSSPYERADFFVSVALSGELRKRKLTQIAVPNYTWKREEKRF